MQTLSIAVARIVAVPTQVHKIMMAWLVEPIIG